MRLRELHLRGGNDGGCTERGGAKLQGGRKPCAQPAPPDGNALPYRRISFADELGTAGNAVSKDTLSSESISSRENSDVQVFRVSTHRTH